MSSQILRVNVRLSTIIFFRINCLSEVKNIKLFFLHQILLAIQLVQLQRDIATLLFFSVKEFLVVSFFFRPNRHTCSRSQIGGTPNSELH